MVEVFCGEDAIQWIFGALRKCILQLPTSSSNEEIDFVEMITVICL